MNNVSLSSQRSKKCRENCTVENCDSRSDKDVNLSFHSFLQVNESFVYSENKWKNRQSKSLGKSNEGKNVLNNESVSFSHQFKKEDYNILPETVTAEQGVNRIIYSQSHADTNCEESKVEIINEKIKPIAKEKTSQKNEPPPSDEIHAAAKDDSTEGDRYYADQPRQGQTPYYQQQQVGGVPVYVQGAPPANAARMAPYQARQHRDHWRNNSSEDNLIFGDTFIEQAIRNRFVQRVYTILTIQLIYTCGFIGICIFVPEVKKFVLGNGLIFILAGVVEMVILFTLTCCIAPRRTFPLNFVLLAIFTIAFAYIMAVVSATYSTSIVMSSMGITAGVCLAVSIFACQTSCDITTWGAYLCVISLVVAIVGLVGLLVLLITGNKLVFLIYAALIAIVFSLYLMYDTQMIMGGRRIELSPEEYIFGALTLYVDIMEIFWAILILLGMSRD